MHQSLLGKLQRISRRGLLADWGYAVPFYPLDTAKPPSPVDATPDHDTIHHQSTSAVASSSLLTSLSTLDETPTSPIAFPGDLDEDTIPV